MRKITALLTLSLVVLAAIPASAGIIQRGGSPVVTQPPSTQPCSASTQNGINTVPVKNSGTCTSAGSGTGTDTRSGGGLLVGPPTQQLPGSKNPRLCVGALCVSNPFSGH